MPAKKSTSTVTMPKTWLIAGALVLGAAVVAQAVNSNKQNVGINEVKTAKVQDGSYSGTVGRETNEAGKERYVLTTSSGTKYLLIGLKKSYEVNEEKGKDKDKGKPSTKPSVKPSPKADKEDVESFEQYVGKKVTITGMVVPVGSDNTDVKPSKEPKESKEPKDMKENKGKNPEKSPKAEKPEMSPRASESESKGAWEYDRLVVKDLVVVQ